jgi:hypothetical protein
MEGIHDHQISFPKMLRGVPIFRSERQGTAIIKACEKYKSH